MSLWPESTTKLGLAHTERDPAGSHDAFVLVELKPALVELREPERLPDPRLRPWDLLDVCHIPLDARRRRALRVLGADVLNDRQAIRQQPVPLIPVEKEEV